MEILVELWITYSHMAPYLVIGFLIAGLLHVFVQPDFVAKHLGKPGFLSVIKASILGVPVPLCSCGVVPAALSLKKSGATGGAVVSFLTSTPQTGVDSIAATYGMMGPFMAFYRPFAAFFMGVFGGLLTDAIAPDRLDPPPKVNKTKRPPKTLRSVMQYGFGELLGSVSGHLFIGILLSALLAYLLPSDFFSGKFNSYWQEMLLMTAVGAPLYLCSTGSIPIAVTMISKGLSPGAAFVFLAVGPATNIAKIIMLGGQIGIKRTTVYIVSMIISALIFGALLNESSFASIMIIEQLESCHDEASSINYFNIIISLALLIPFVTSLYNRYIKRYIGRLFNSLLINNDGLCITTFVVEGMSCQNCVAKITKEISKIDGVKSVDIDLKRERMKVVSLEDISSEVLNLISGLGYRSSKDA